MLFEDFHVENASATHGRERSPPSARPPCHAAGEAPRVQDLDLSSCIAPVTFTCTAKTCAEQGFGCGAQGDGCGNGMPLRHVPGARDVRRRRTATSAERHVCAALTCASRASSCGPAGDGCGDELSAARALRGRRAARGKPGVCAPNTGTCTPTTCAAQGLSCGPAGDGCGNEIQCGPAPRRDTCGGGGTPGKCGGRAVHADDVRQRRGSTAAPAGTAAANEIQSAVHRPRHLRRRRHAGRVRLGVGASAALTCEPRAPACAAFARRRNDVASIEDQAYPRYQTAMRARASLRRPSLGPLAAGLVCAAILSACSDTTVLYTVTPSRPHPPPTRRRPRRSTVSTPRAPRPTPSRPPRSAPSS